MIRAKPKKKKKDPPSISTHFIMSVIMPCVMLGCKDEFKIRDQERLDRLARRIQQYIDYLADGVVSHEELNSLIKCENLPKEEEEWKR